MRTIAMFALAAITLTACNETIAEPSIAPEAASLARTGPAGAASYEVVITNLTSGQPLTPPLAVTHRQSLELFRVGSAANFELKEIAENGNLAPMLGVIGGHRHVADSFVSVGDPPPLLPGEARSFQLQSEMGARYFSFVSMLICTNDGFTGVDSARLPADVGETVTWVSFGYDAGTEINTEDWDDLVPPCGPLTGFDTGSPGSGVSNPALAEDGVIHHHGGIAGGADLVPGVHGWVGPVVQVEVTRIM